MGLAGCTSPEKDVDEAEKSRADSDPVGNSSLDGSWTITRAIINGKSYPQAGQVDIHVGGKYEFDSGQLTKHSNPGVAFKIRNTRFRFKLTANTNPTQLELVEENGDVVGNSPTEKLIFRLHGDQLTLCWSLDLAAPVPQDFETSPGDNKRVFFLRRSVD
jgi:uncharacterized protein (TIGR03067 family)